MADERAAATTSDSKEEVGGKKHLTSYAETLMHMVKAYTGSGMFALGDAYKNTGYIVGTALLAVIALMSVYCQHLLVICIKRVETVEETAIKSDYGEAAKHSFIIGPEKYQKCGPRIKNLINTFLFICEIGTCCSYIVFIGDHLRQIGDTYGWHADIHTHMAYSTFFLWMITFVSSLKYLAPLSYAANVITLVGCVLIYYITGSEMPDPITGIDAAAPPQRYPMGFGTCLFAFAGIVCVPTLRSEMKNRERMGGVVGILNVSALIVFVIYVAIGLMSYMRYGQEIQGSVFLNFPAEGNMGLVCDITKLLMVLSTFITYTIHMYVIHAVCYPLYYERVGPFRHETFQWALFKTIIVLITFILANVVPFLSLFISLTGALAGSVLILLMTPLMHFAAFSGTLNPGFYVINIFIIVFAITGMFVGTGVSIYEMYKAFQEKYTTDDS